MIGTVKWYDHKKGFGFITNKNNEKDIFVHFSDIDEQALDTNREVIFDVIEYGKLLRAKNVKEKLKMSKTEVMLNEITKVKKFNNEVAKFESDIDLVRGRYVIDAKSAMGIFTLDLSVPVEVLIHSNDEKEIKRFCEVMEEFK